MLYRLQLVALISLLLATALPVAGQGSEEELDIAARGDYRFRSSRGQYVDVINIAPVFEAFQSSASKSINLGLVSEIPIAVKDESDSYSPYRKFIIYRNRRPMRLRQDQSVTFRFLVGNLQRIYFWIDSYPDKLVWDVRYYLVELDGRRTMVSSSNLRSRQFRDLKVQPHTQLEIVMQPMVNQTMQQRDCWISISPEPFNREGIVDVISLPSSLHTW